MPLTPIKVKQYVALLSQTGTGAPSAIILQNNIGTILWTRVGVGTYEGTLTAAFPQLKTYLSITANSQSNTDFAIYNNIDGEPSNSVGIITKASGSASDGILDFTPVEIRIWEQIVSEI